MLILLAEDHEDSRTMVSDALKLVGHRVIAFPNGKELLERIYAEDELPFVVITDLMMPAMSGFDVIADLRQQGLLDVIPVIVMSALENDDPDIVALAKPLDLQKMFKAVERASERATADVHTTRVRLERAKLRRMRRAAP